MAAVGYFLSLIGTLIFLTFLGYSFCVSLIQLAEYFEDKSSVAIKIINILLIVVSALTLIAVLSNELPLSVGLLILMSHVFFKLALAGFPVVNLSLALIAGLCLIVIAHIILLWRLEFLFSGRPFAFLGFFTLFLWLIPVMVILSVNEKNTFLPSYISNQHIPSRRGSVFADWLKRLLQALA